jgi:D-threo-aldose 1-dehydrogenase
LLDQSLFRRVLPAAEKHDVGVVAGGPFRDGLLAAKMPQRLEEYHRTKIWNGLFSDRVVRQIHAFYALSDETGIAMHEMSLRYILGNPRIHTVIPGAQKAAEVQSNCDAVLKGPLPGDVLARIETIQRL